jgi:hypothetical protein
MRVKFSELRYAGAVVALAALFFVAGCDKDTEAGWTQVKLDDKEFTEAKLSLKGAPGSISVSGGSGDYSVVIDEPSVADVSIKLTDGAGTMLFMEPKAVGLATVTVTDKKSGLFARCELRVNLFTTAFSITNVLVDIDAETPLTIETVEAFLAADKTIPPVNGAIYRNYDDDPADWKFVGEQGENIASGTLTEEQLSELPDVFNNIKPKGGQEQTDLRRKLVLLDEGGNRRELCMAIYDGQSESTRMNMPPIVLGDKSYTFYEDLTEYYKNKFPDVKRVVRVLNSRRSYL